MACLSRWLVVLVMIAGIFASDDRLCPEPQAALKLPGHATVYGLFDAHSGDNCSDLSVSGLQQMAAAAWMISSLNQITYVPGVKLGLALYDGCSSALATQKTLLSSVVDMGCDNSYVLGLVTSPPIVTSLQTLPKDLQISIFSTPEPSSKKLLIQTAVQLLATLKWTTVGCLLAPSLDIINTFNYESVASRLCALQEAMLPNGDKQNWTSLLDGPLSSLSQDSVVVVIGSWEQIVSTLQISRGLNISLQWIIVPLDTLQNVSNIAELPTDSLVILPGVGILQQDEETHISFEDHHKYDVNVMNSEERLLISYPLFMQVALPMMQIINTFKTAYSMHCSNDSEDLSSVICSQLPEFNSLAIDQHGDTEEVTKMLKSNSHVVLSAVSRVTVGTVLEEVAVYDSTFEEKSVKLRLIINITNSVPRDAFCTLNVGYNVTGRDCQRCSNFAHYYIAQRKEIGIREIFAAISWRPDAWVAAIASIGAVGITCCIVILIFIAVRICKGDVLEGNPSFSYFLILSIIFTYGATLPFSLEVDNTNHFLSNLFCSLRVTGTSMSYALLFSIMFSRSLMLASCDHDGGFMSHINGYLQYVLCFFVLAVQVALSTQFWIINSTFLNPSQCASMHEGYYFQILLCYDIFLLLLLVCTCPFAVKSKRNYREGMYFMIASILSLLIWVGWTMGYLLSPREWQDAAVSGGLAATATGVLVTVFIPRTYMMMTAIVRDNLASALPTLTCANSTSILDLNYRATSHQALYDCVNPVLSYTSGQVNPNFYSEHPETHSNNPYKSRSRHHSPAPENTYQRCDSPSSPNKVTHF